MTRIAFLADLHVDTYGSRIDPDTGLNARLIDYLNTLRWIAADAFTRNVDAMVIAGDLTERRHCPAWLAALIRDALGTGRPLYVLRGNHDGEVGERSVVDVIGDRGFRSIATVWLDGIRHVDPDVGFVMLPFADRHYVRSTARFNTADEASVRREVADGIVDLARGGYAALYRENPGAPKILVMHQTIAGAALSDAQRAYLGDQDTVVDGTALASIGFDLIISGHLHRHQVVETGGPTPIIYPGSIERVDFGEEGDPKGYIVADLPGINDEPTTWQFVPTPARAYVTVDWADGVMATPDWPGLEGAIVRVRNLPRDQDPDAIRAALMNAGAFDVYAIEREPVEPTAAGGLPETLTPAQAVALYFDAHPDREALVPRAQSILLEASDRTR